MNRIEELDAIVKTYDLNAHPFYQDWRMGTLPLERLRDYAAEYGRFIGTIAEGWETVGQPGYAAEERYHEQLWAEFQKEIGASAPTCRPTTEALVTAARCNFQSKPQAIGALYSFEAQQPATSQSKHDGLTEHYGTSDAGKEYFLVHAGDVAEIELLRAMVADLDDAEFQQAKHACAAVCASMLGALDGVYYN